MKQALIGVSIVAVLLLIGGRIALQYAMGGYSVRRAPTFAEAYLARRAHDMAISASDKALANPTQNTPEILAQARAHWADHCANCHANNGSGDAEMGKNLYPPAPDMRLAATQDLTDGQLFFIIENGIRMTGMPAWGGPGHKSDDSWKLVHFIRHLPQLTADEESKMKMMNPRTPAELEEEKAETEFLRGDDTHAQHHSHH